jgi:hypothetical protein
LKSRLFSLAAAEVAMLQPDSWRHLPRLPHHNRININPIRRSTCSISRQNSNRTNSFLVGNELQSEQIAEGEFAEVSDISSHSGTSLLSFFLSRLG